MPATIRPAAQADLAAIHRLVAELAAAHVSVDPARYTALATAWGEYERALTTVEALRPLLWLVAESDGQISGYLMAEHVEADDLVWSPEHVCIHDVLVDREARNSGAARTLIEAAAAWARGRGVRQLRLFTDDRNETARAVFGRMGFRRTMVEMTRDL